jgi:cobalt-zinc-cadmium efflux system outer membrane protein
MFTVSAALSLMLAAVSADAWTLERVVSSAVERSPEVAAARAEETSAEAVRSADGRWLQVNPELEVEATRDVLTGNPGAQRVEVMLSQKVEVAGQRGLRVARADASLDAARARRRAAVLEAAAEAVRAAVELERREARARLAEESLGLARALEVATERRFAAGDVPELERNGAVLERARAEARAALARAESDAARAALNRRLGRPAAAPLSVAVVEARGEGAPGMSPRSMAAVEARGEGAAVAQAEAGPRPTVAQPLSPAAARPELRTARASLPSPLLSERPELQAARAEEAAAKAEVELLRRERFPDPTLGLGYERERRPESHGAASDLHTEHLLVARLSVPLPLWERNQRELAEASARHSARSATRVAREREAEADSTVARSAFDAARAAHLALEAARPAAERNLELVRRAYDSGELGLDALLLARDRAFSARAETVDAAAEVARARTALLRAEGRLPTGGVPQ